MESKLDLSVVPNWKSYPLIQGAGVLQRSIQLGSLRASELRILTTNWCSRHLNAPEHECPPAVRASLGRPEVPVLSTGWHDSAHTELLAEILHFVEFGGHAGESHFSRVARVDETVKNWSMQDAFNLVNFMAPYSRATTCGQARADFLLSASMLERYRASLSPVREAELPYIAERREKILARDTEQLRVHKKELERRTAATLKLPVADPWKSKDWHESRALAVAPPVDLNDGEIAMLAGGVAGSW